MKKRIISACMMIVLAALTILSTVSCGFSMSMIRGSGNIITRTWNDGTFTAVNISHTFKAGIEYGTECSVAVTADDNLINDYIGIFLDDETLTVTLDPMYNYHDATATVKITLPVLTTVKIDGVSEAVVTGFPKFTNLTTIVSGVSELTASIDADTLTANASGVSKLNLNGSVSSLALTVSGVSTVSQTGALTSASVRVSGTSDVRLEAPLINDLELDVSGVSKLKIESATTASGYVSGCSELLINKSCPTGNISVSGTSSIEGGDSGKK